MKTVGFLSALCCGLFLSGGAALGVANDCDCDGTSDADEKAACRVDCCDAAALNGNPCVVTPPNSSQTKCLGLCDQLNCYRDLTDGTCCNRATGVEVTLCDDVDGTDEDCTNDTCVENGVNDTIGSTSAGKSSPATKNCDTDRGHGTPTHVADHGFCRQYFDATKCSVDSAACGDKDVKCLSYCSVEGVGGGACTLPADCGNVCKLSPHAFCKDNGDCTNATGDSCVPQTCDPQTCIDNTACDFWVCNPIIATAGDDGCERDFAPLLTSCTTPPKSAAEDPDCNNPDTCDGKGTCNENYKPAATACTPDKECQAGEAACPSGTCTNKVCNNDLYAPCSDGTACGRCKRGKEVCTSSASCGKVCNNCPNKSCDNDEDCGPGSSDCGGPFKGSCVADPCEFGSCGADACVLNACTKDACDGAGVCAHTALTGACTSDGNQCTADTCQDVSGVQHCVEDVTLGATCNDNDKCTNGTVCVTNANYVPAVSCGNGTLKDCTDTNPCTTDSCNACDARAKPDGCVNHYAGAGDNPDCVNNKGDVLCRKRIAFEPYGSNSIPINTPFPDDDRAEAPANGDKFDNNASLLQNSCFVVETWCIDGSAAQTGVSCAYTEETIGDKECPAIVEDTTGDGVAINISKNFPEFQDGFYIIEEFTTIHVGGCTTEACVGVNEWVLVDTLEVAAPQDTCKGAVISGADDNKSCGIYGEGKTPCEFIKKDKVDRTFDVICWGYLYNHEQQGECYAKVPDSDSGFPCVIDTNCFSDEVCNKETLTCWLANGTGQPCHNNEQCIAQGFDHCRSGNQSVETGDFSYLVPCYGLAVASNPDCAEYDYDLDGTIGSGDFGWFVTAWQKHLCAGGIAIPAEQLHCAGSGGSANAGYIINADGNIEEVEIAPATQEQLDAFGLVMPEPVSKERLARPRTEVKGTR
jgi:hypothetical protein